MKTVQSVLNFISYGAILSYNSLANLPETWFSPMQEVIFWDNITFLFLFYWVHVEGLG